MRTTQVNIHKFSELSPEAKQKAKDDYANACGYSWGDEALASLKALAEHFRGRLANYDIDWFASTYSSARFAMPDGMSRNEIHRRLRELGSYNRATGKGHGECKLTGVCFDEDAIDGFRAGWRAGERDLDKLMQAAFTNLLRACQADAAEQYTDEAFAEHCEANDYEFYATGEFYH